MQTVETILGNKPSLRKAILLEYVKTPDGILVKEIEKRLGVSGLDKNHLTKLEEFGILEIHHIKVRRPAGRFKTETMCTDKGYRLKQDPDTFDALTKAFDHDRDSQTVFMRSQYYRGMIPDLVKQFVDWIRWECGLTEKEKSKEKSSMTDALKENWLALKWVAHFISVTEDERNSILLQLMESVRNPHTSPAAAHATGYTKGFCLGMDACQLLIPDDKKKMFIDKRIKAEWDNAPFGEHINWRELFHQLDHFNSNYPYLFD